MTAAASLAMANGIPVIELKGSIDTVSQNEALPCSGCTLET